MTGRPWLITSLALLLVIAVLGCSERTEDAPWTSLRLVDVADAADIESSWDPTAPMTTGAGRAELGRTRLGDLPRRTSARSDGTWVHPYLLGRPPAPGSAAVTLRVAQVAWTSPRPARVRIDFDGAAGPDDAWFAVPMSARLLPKQLGDRTALEPILNRPRRLEKLAPAGDGVWSAVVALVPRTTAILIVALGSGPAVDDALLEVDQIDPGLAWVAKSEPTDHSPWCRRVEVDDIVRECLVFGSEATARFRVRVPADSPSFSSWVADPFDDGRGPASVFEVSATHGAERIAAEASPPSATWRALELDLTPFAGEEVELVLSAAGRAGTFALFGQPEVTGGARGALPLDVVLISLDTVRADRTSLHGGRAGTTPTLERLAESSAVFDAAIATAPWTLPSHLSMLSGFYPDRHGVTKALGRLGDDVPWLVEELRAAGYRTLAYAASGYVHPQFGFARGFERYGTRDPVNPPLAWARLRPDQDDRSMLERAERADLERAELLSVLRGERDRPLFLFLHTYQAHDYHAPPEVLRSFGAAPDELETLLDGVYRKGSPFLDGSEKTPEREATLKRHAELLYDAALSVADAFVADVVLALEESGRLDRTILIVVSDHGEELFDRGGFGHGNSVHEELIRVPLLIRVPGASARRIQDVVSHVDLAPTLRHRLGLTTSDGDPVRTDGRDLSPLLVGESLEGRPAMARGGGRSGEAAILRALRGRDLKLIETRQDGVRGRTELYDLVSDPREERDVAASRTEELDRLVDRLERHVMALRALSSTSGETDPSAELRAALEELGYLGDD